MKQQVTKLLQHPEFFEGEYWQRRKVKAGEQVMRQGESGDSFFVVESGFLRVLGHIELDERRQVSPGVCDLRAGDVVGEVVLFDKGPRSASVNAIEDSVLIEINGPKLMKFLQQHSDIGFEFMRALMEVMVARLRSTNKKIFSLLAWGLKAHNIEKEL